MANPLTYAVPAAAAGLLVGGPIGAAIGGAAGLLIGSAGGETTTTPQRSRRSQRPPQRLPKITPDVELDPQLREIADKAGARAAAYYGGGPQNPYLSPGIAAALQAQQDDESLLGGFVDAANTGNPLAVAQYAGQTYFNVAQDIGQAYLERGYAGAAEEAAETYFEAAEDVGQALIDQANAYGNAVINEANEALNDFLGFFR